MSYGMEIAELMAKCDIDQALAKLREQFYLAQQSLEKIASWISFETTTNSQIYFVRIKGPDETPYEGGIYKLKVYLPLNFPKGRPSIQFVTRIYHPNVDIMGRIGPDFNSLFVWTGEWTGLTNALLAIRNLMQRPNLGVPLSTSIGRQFQHNRNIADVIAREWNTYFATQ